MLIISDLFLIHLNKEVELRAFTYEFFRSESERLSEEFGSNGIIYTIEEPETFQHTNNQKKLIKVF